MGRVNERAKACMSWLRTGIGWDTAVSRGERVGEVGNGFDSENDGDEVGCPSGRAHQRPLAELTQPVGGQDLTPALQACSVNHWTLSEVGV